MSAPSRSHRNPATTYPTVVGRSRLTYDMNAAQHMSWVERATRGDEEGLDMIRESIETHLTNIGTGAQSFRPDSTSNLYGAGPLDLFLAPPEFNGVASRIENATGSESPAERAFIVDLAQGYIRIPALRAHLNEFYHRGYHGGGAAGSGDRQGGNQHAGTVDGDGVSNTYTGAQSSSRMGTGTHQGDRQKIHDDDDDDDGYDYQPEKDPDNRRVQEQIWDELTALSKNGCVKARSFM